MSARHLYHLARLLLCAAALIHLPAASAASPAGANLCGFNLYLPALRQAGAAAHLAAPTGAPPAIPSPRAEPVPDLNNDGCADLLIGVPHENYGAASNSGAVYIVPGSLPGLATEGAALWQRSSRGLEYDETPFAYFGWAPAVGDFDGDGFQDLAVSAPEEAPGGQVYVLYGTDQGPTAAGHQVWNNANVGIESSTVRFGYSLAAADFDQDGYDDLAIGDPFQHLGKVLSAGAVYVLYGTVDGLVADHSQYWHLALASLPGDPEEDGHFGEALTAGDFDGDGFPDLAIGAPWATSQAGQVFVLHGSPSRLTAEGVQQWHQNVTGVVGASEPGDRFGEALAAGDFNADGYADLAVGVRWEDIGGINDAGAVNVLYGTASGLAAAGNHLLTQDQPDLQDEAEANDDFGRALTAGDFNADGYADLALGANHENLETEAVSNAGVVHVVFGSAAGLTALGSQRLHLGSQVLPDQPLIGDELGSALAAADYNRDGFADLALSAPGRTVGGQAGAGTVFALFGSQAGLTAGDYQEISENSPGLVGEPETFDNLGYSLR